GAQRLLVRPPLLLVQAFRLDVVVLRGAVLGAQLLELAVAGAVPGVALDEERQLHHGEPPLVLGAPLVELASGLVGADAALLPGRERRLVARPQVLERWALGAVRARAAAGAERCRG